MKRALLILVLILTVFFAIRIYDTQRGPDLKVWHTYVPEELSREELNKTDWAGYLAHEEKIFTQMREDVSQELEDADRDPINRYFQDSMVYPESLSHNWNRSYTLRPQGEPKGVVVLLHGLTDSPYSLRHMGRLYRDNGFVVVAPRLPGHGTVPAGLTVAQWTDWVAATQLVIREARSLVPAPKAFHIVGFSNGGALAVRHALDAIENPNLAKPDRLILLSPMVGITGFARFAGLAGLPAFFPRFAKAAWLSIMPEFNPFKYNSFPVNGARQSHQLTRDLQSQLARLSRQNQLGEFPPTLTFQSVLDFTVSTRAIITEFYDRLPTNGSELVLFDLNRSAKIGGLFREASENAIQRVIRPGVARNYKTVILTNAGPGLQQVVARTTAAGSTEETVTPLMLNYPREVFSLSHVAIPFPMWDSLYGTNPSPTADENYGVHLGEISTRGEVGVLIVNLDSLLRMSSNPFYDFMMGQVQTLIRQP